MNRSWGRGSTFVHSRQTTVSLSPQGTAKLVRRYATMGRIRLAYSTVAAVSGVLPTLSLGACGPPGTRHGQTQVATADPRDKARAIDAARMRLKLALQARAKADAAAGHSGAFVERN
jgi:hypothetical protein